MGSTDSSASTSSSPTSPDASTVPETMRAWTQKRYGDATALTLSTVPCPRPQAGQVLLKVLSSSVNAADSYFSSGRPMIMRATSGLRGPKDPTPGLDAAGTVVAVGDGVTQWTVGDVVVGETGAAWAEYSIAKAERLARVPTNLDPAVAGCVPVAGLTALQGLRDKGGLTPGSGSAQPRVLVLGATGGVGTLAVQVAAALGAHVTATCRASYTDQTRSLGAHEVLDDSTGDPTDRLIAAIEADSGAAFDVVYDVIGVSSTRRRGALLAPAGVCVLVGAPSGGAVLGPVTALFGTMIAARFVKGRFTSFVAASNGDDMQTLMSMIEKNELRVVVSETFGFDQIPAALERFRAGGLAGKVAIDHSL